MEASKTSVFLLQHLPEAEFSVNLIASFHERHFATYKGLAQMSSPLRLHNTTVR